MTDQQGKRYKVQGTRYVLYMPRCTTTLHLPVINEVLFGPDQSLAWCDVTDTNGEPTVA